MIIFTLRAEFFQLACPTDFGVDSTPTGPRDSAQIGPVFPTTQRESHYLVALGMSGFDDGEQLRTGPRISANNEEF